MNLSKCTCLFPPHLLIHLKVHSHEKVRIHEFCMRRCDKIKSSSEQHHDVKRKCVKTLDAANEMLFVNCSSAGEQISIKIRHFASLLVWNRISDLRGATVAIHQSGKDYRFKWKKT